MADRPEKEGNLVVDALQYVTHAIIALRDFDDPDRNGTAALWLSRALNRLQGELTVDGLTQEDRTRLAAAQARLEYLLANLRRSGTTRQDQHHAV
jgi:hypothetical protein